MAVHDTLNQHFYPPFIHPSDRLGPISELVSCILSQRTRDEVANRAFRNLTGAIWDWTEARDASPRRIMRLIAEVTWPDQKAEYIRDALVTISDWSNWNKPSLDFLEKLSDSEASARLRQLNGVGPKTAAATLLFSTLRRATLPVDTHYFRAALRLGLIPAGCDETSAHVLLRAQLPADWQPADIERQYFLMKGLGQQFCTARYPRCAQCPVRRMCVLGGGGVSSK